MKKILIGALAVGMFTACSQDETISMKSPSQISFEGAWVENASRANKATDPSTTTAKLTGFDVWAYMDNPTGKILEGEDVSGTQGNFTYANTQYWYADHTYYFAAMAPMNSKNVTVTTPTTENANNYGLGTVKFSNEDGSEDLLYAAAKRVLSADADLSNQEVVKFTFNHLLSKVKFSFKNTFTNSNINFEVKDIKMTAPKVGTIDLNQANWWDTNEWVLDNKATPSTLDLSFGTTGKVAQATEQECAEERLTIPTDATTYPEYKITFTVDLYNGSVLANTYKHEITLSGVDFKIGKAYDLYAELNANNIVDPDDEENDGMYEIVFDVQEVKNWEQGDAVSITTNVATEEALKEAIQKGGEIYLEQDITLTSTLNVSGDATIYLNGKTLTNQVGNTSTDVIVVAEGATLTINGDGKVTAVTGNDGYAVIAKGTVIINGGTYEAGVDADGEANAVIYARDNGKVYVNGGTFPNASSSTYVLNKKDADRATTTIEVTGGTFTNFNPGNNAAEGAGTNFLAEGYVSTETAEGNNVWTVTKGE